MSGYAPLFSSLTTGTLCGKWPDIGLWPIVLSLKDRNGVVDVTPDYLSRVTGLSLDEVVACMSRFCEPDPYSRSSLEDGRRLVLVEPERRNWGWRVVNSGLYRERARLQSRDAQRTQSGEDASRKRKARASPDVPRSPPDSVASPEVPPSDAEAKACKNNTAKRGVRMPDPFPVTDEMRAWAKSETPDVDVTAATAEFADYWRSVPGQKGCKLDWVATWRNRLREMQGRVKSRGGRANGGASEWR